MSSTLDAQSATIEGVPNAPLITATDLHLSYGPAPALTGASMEVRPGEVVVLTGKSGSGKSSLLYCLAGIVRPDRGSLHCLGHDLMESDDERLSELRRKHFGFVFQFGELVPELSLRENVGLPLRLNGVSARDARARTAELLDSLDIGEVSHKRPGEVSGGQAQRAAVARALVHDPQIVFADEPTGSLDSENATVVLNRFIELARTTGAAVVLVTHESGVAAIADRRLEVVDGKVYPSPADA